MLLHPRPHGPVLAPAGARALLGGGPADGQRARVPCARDAPRDAVGRRRGGLHHARAGEVADDGAHDLVVGARRAGERADRHVEAPRRPVRGSEQGPRDGLERGLLHRGALDEEDVQALVAGRGEEQAAGGTPVAAGATGLLVVGLDRPGHGLVADRAHVGLVDAHAERVGGHDDPRVARHEAALRLGPRVARHAGVVGQHLDAERVAEAPRQPVALRARARVDDRGQRPRLGEHRRDAAVRRLLRRTRDHREGEVRAVEARRHVDGIAQPEAGDDVRRHLWRRGGRGGDDGLGAEPARGVRQAEVVRPEVVPPLRDAVRLVHHEEADARVADALEEAGRGEPLGRDVEDPGVPRHGPLDRRAVGRRVLLRVDERDAAGRDAAPAPPPGPA